MGKRKLGFSFRLAVVTSALLVAVSLLLGYVLTAQSRESMKILIDNRMLDISNTSAAMLDGDILASLKKEDKGTEGYQHINDILAVYQDNIDLKYIYCVREEPDGSFTFTVDPTIEDPGEFGEPVVVTEALKRAAKGEPAVDEEPYSDDWGRFYSAYSPVFDSKGDVAGIVAVDFSAEWFEDQINRQTRAVFAGCIVAMILGIVFIMIVTGIIRRHLIAMTDDLKGVMKDLHELSREINPDTAINDPLGSHADVTDSVEDLGKNVRAIRDSMAVYRENINTQANSMITALSSEYRSVYYVDFDSGEGVCYQTHSHLDNGLNKGERFTYLNVFRDYAYKYVSEGHREEFLHFIEPEQIKKRLLTETIITLLYVVNQDGKESYEMLRMAGVRRPEDRDDGIVHAAGVGFTDVDAETRRALNQSRALSDALAAAETANKAKTAFLSNMSHEIRTPLNAIIGLDRIALMDPGISNDTKDHLEKIGTSADHLLGIINDILDMSRIEAGRMVLNYETFSLKNLIDQIDVMIGGQCRDKGLNWEITPAEDVLDYYIGDEMKLKQVLINILGNSVKFTPAGGTVSFDIRLSNRYDNKSTFIFTMKDTGIGMSEEFLPKLFEAFSQADYSTKTKYGSTGLGMSITRNIVELMNGRISVTSEVGKGTVFVVRLTFEDSSDSDVRALNGVAGVKSEEDKASLSGKRILLAEDVEVNAEIIQMMLGMRDIRVEHAENGRKAVDFFTNHPEGYYDAILMDMRMPEMDGLEASEAIRALDRADAQTIPIIALTANAFDEDVRQSLQAGLNAHLSKPIEPDILFATLEELIN